MDKTSRKIDESIIRELRTIYNLMVPNDLEIIKKRLNFKTANDTENENQEPEIKPQPTETFKRPKPSSTIMASYLKKWN